MTGFEVLATGPLAVWCDMGRSGHAAVGVSGSGAADRGAFALGQRLLGQDNRAALEVMLGGLVLRADQLAWIALTGADAAATLDSRPVGHGAAFVVTAGQELRLGMPTRGLRTYVSVRGGFVPPSAHTMAEERRRRVSKPQTVDSPSPSDVRLVLGSWSTDVLSGLGPPPLRVGDHLGVGPVPAELDFAPVDFAAPMRHAPAGPIVLEFVPGPREDWFPGLAGLTGPTWQVSPDSNRVGVRLTGPALERRADRRELASEPMVRGSIQVPPNGQPVVFGADHPVTGGYPVIGVLTAAASDLIAQARPGDAVRFTELRPGGARGA